MGSYGVLKVVSKETGKEIFIKSHRFNSQFHEKIPGEPTRVKEYAVEQNKPIVLDPIQSAVEKGKENARKAKEETNVPLEEMKFQEIRALAKKKGLVIPNTDKKEEVIAKIRALEV
tara:strand:+ start:714 stop:1061 length:348 start_codon:yes stop_codon:yes gene_type:complete